jgi:hypothetical protein
MDPTKSYKKNRIIILSDKRRLSPVAANSAAARLGDRLSVLS